MDYEALPDEIKRFITCVLGKALDELGRIDSRFVEQMEEIYRLESIDLSHAARSGTSVPVPSTRLSDDWHKTLESILDMYAAIQTLELSTNLIGADSADPDMYPIGVLVNYHLANWWPNAQAVVEKTGVCMKQVLRRIGMPRSVSRPLEEALMSELDVMEQALERRRDPDLHGGPGNLFEAITEEGLWEGMVALRMSPAETVDGISNQAADRQQQRAIYSRRNSDALYGKVAEVLGRLADEIGCDQEFAPLRSS